MNRENTWSRTAPRFIAPAVALVVFLVTAIFYWLQSVAIYDVLRLWGVPSLVRYPFLDLRYIFAGIECWGKGVDVYAFDPCDPLGRLHAYSPLWLRLPFLPSQQWAPAAGIVIDVLFLLSLAALPRPHKRSELVILLFAVLSPPVVLALQRANIDVVIFMVMLGAGALWVQRLPHRTLSYVIVFAAGLLKFYPLVLLALAVRERIKISVTVFAIAGALLFVFGAYFYHELVEMAPNIPTGSYFVGDMFGAKNLPDGLLFVLGFPKRSWFGVLLWITLLAVPGSYLITMLRWPDLRRGLGELEALDTALLLVGAALICGCFLAGQSDGYREIFLLFLLPGLLALSRGAADRRVRSFAKRSCFFVVVLLWQGVLTWNDLFLQKMYLWFGSTFGFAIWTSVWLARELIWWWVVAVLAGMLACFVMESHTGLWLRERLIQRAGAERR